MDEFGRSTALRSQYVARGVSSADGNGEGSESSLEEVLEEQPPVSWPASTNDGSPGQGSTGSQALEGDAEREGRKEVNTGAVQAEAEGGLQKGSRKRSSPEPLRACQRGEGRSPKLPEASPGTSGCTPDARRRSPGRSWMVVLENPWIAQPGQVAI